MNSEEVLSVTPAGKTTNWKKLALIVSVLLVGTTVILAITFFKYEETKTTIAELLMEGEEMQADKQLFATQIDDLEAGRVDMWTIIDIMGAAQTSKVMLSNSKSSPGFDCFVYWDKNTGDLLLDTKNLPVPDEDKQYQLWSITKDKKHDLGIVYHDESASTSLQTMFKAYSALSFVLTLENEGGSEVFSMDKMILQGKI